MIFELWFKDCDFAVQFEEQLDYSTEREGLTATVVLDRRN